MVITRAIPVCIATNCVSPGQKSSSMATGLAIRVTRVFGELTSIQLTLLVLAGLMGGLVRGYSGFGFALVAVPVLNLGFPPTMTVPSVLLVEFAIGLFTVRGERAHIDWKILGILLCGTIVGTPLGALLLSQSPAEVTRLAVAIVALIAAFLLWRRPRLSTSGRLWPFMGGGLFSGILNGGTALSGPPAILVLLGSSLPEQSVRAILIAFILFSAALGIGITAAFGLQDGASLARASVMAPAVALGTTVGIMFFKNLPARLYRMSSLVVLMMVSVMTMGLIIWNFGHALMQ